MTQPAKPVYYVLDDLDVPLAEQREMLMKLHFAVPVRHNVLEPLGRPNSLSFRCAHCGKITHWPEGGADMLPYGCDDCWGIAAAVLREAGYQP